MNRYRRSVNRTAIYTRVSTAEQTVEPQLIELRAYAASKGLNIVSELTDTISGSKNARQGLDQLMAMVRSGAVDCIVVTKLDRLARSLSHFTQMIDEFAKHRVAFICPGQGIDTSTSNPAGTLQLQILGAVAQFERDLIRDRTKAGLAAAKARGVILGKPSTRLPANHADVIHAWWKETGGKHVRDLALRLNGVAITTAYRLAKKFKPVEPAA